MIRAAKALSLVFTAALLTAAPAAARTAAADPAMQDDKGAYFPAPDRCAAARRLAYSKDQDSREELLDSITDTSDPMRSCAIRAAGEAGLQEAVPPLLSAVEAYLSSGKHAYDRDMKARLQTIDAIWALGEIGSPEVMARLQEFYLRSDDTLKINLVVGVSKQPAGAKAADWLRSVAADAAASGIVRAAAYETLADLGESAPPAEKPASDGMLPGDIIYTGGIIGTISGWFSEDLPLGHAAIFAGVEVKDGALQVLIAECVPNYDKPGGIRNVYTWSKFTTHYKFPYYGNRTTRVPPTKEQRETIVATALKMGTLGIRYGDSHKHQKGPDVFDCVGYAEYLYELVGLNPTPNKYEYGLGWPLTPYEQFAATVTPAFRGPYAPAPADPAAVAGPAQKLLEDGLFGARAAAVPPQPSYPEPL